MIQYLECFLLHSALVDGAYGDYPGEYHAVSGTTSSFSVALVAHAPGSTNLHPLAMNCFFRAVQSEHFDLGYIDR